MQQVIPAIALEISVLLLGVLMLLAEAFSKRADRSHMARYAIAILAAIVGFSFFTKAVPGDVQWGMYAVDATALFFKRPTKLLDEVVSGGGAGMRYLALKDFVPLEGGIPIVIDGKIVGAIGVSGVLSTQDTQVARAGIDALAK